MEQDAQDRRDGLITAILAYSLWGIMPIYFTIVGSVDSLEVIAHRIMWAIPFGAVIIALRKQWRDVAVAFADRNTLGWLSLSALMIAINWLIYVWAVQDGKIFESSLAYYITPLLNMLAGVMFFGEKLRRLQTLAVLLAACGVIVLSAQGNSATWISIVLALTFGTYGIIRKQVDVGGMPGLFVETALLAPLAYGWFLWVYSQGNAAFASGDLSLTLWLLLAGPATALPLLFFALAARRLPLTVIGFLQFIGPTLMFLIGIYYGQELTTAHKFCFGCIWLAATFFIYDALKSGKKKAPEKPIPGAV